MSGINELRLKEPNSIVKLRKSYLEQSKSLDYPDFVYGLGISFSPDINLDKIQVKPLKIEISNFESNWQSNFEQLLIEKIPKDKLTMFHLAVSNIFLIDIPKNTKDKITINSLDNGFASIIINVNENSDLIIEELQSSKESGYRSQLILINVKENSNVEYKTFQNLDLQCNNIVYRKAILGQDSKITWIDANKGSFFTRVDTSTFMEGFNSATEVLSLFLGKQDQNYDASINTYHNAANTKSNILTKSILNDNSKSLTRGLIKINENAKFSKGFQKEDAIILSENAEANAIPNLEIRNDEVSCKHAASVGRIDNQHIYYLQTKGLSYDQAKKLILNGFIKEISEKFDKNIQEQLII